MTKAQAETIREMMNTADVARIMQQDGNGNIADHYEFYAEQRKLAQKIIDDLLTLESLRITDFV